MGGDSVPSSGGGSGSTDQRTDGGHDIETEDDRSMGFASAAADDHDVTTMGAAREGTLQRLVCGAVPEAVGDRTRSTALVAQRDVDASSRLKRLLT